MAIHWFKVLVAGEPFSFKSIRVTAKPGCCGEYYILPSKYFPTMC